MQVTESPDASEENYAPTDPIAIEVEDRGIEFPVESLPYAIKGSAISEFRSGVIHIKDEFVKFDGRDTVPDYLRAKLYTIGSFLFLPGLALAYYLIEQVSWIPSSFTVPRDQFIAYTTKDEYSVIALLYNPSGSNTESARRTLTFQLPRGKYLRVKEQLDLCFPDKRVSAPLESKAAAGSESAIIGIVIWVAFIIGTVLWRPT